MEQEKTITNFYKAFQSFNAEGMEVCYHADIEFEDPAFGVLKGKDVMHMWRMLIHRGQPDLKISYSEIKTTETGASGKWEAIYPFSMTGRTVHNRINTRFEFRGGKISKHVDQFDLHRWSGMAFGWKGKIFGGTGFFQNKIRKTALRSLEKWKARVV